MGYIGLHAAIMGSICLFGNPLFASFARYAFYPEKPSKQIIEKIGESFLFSNNLCMERRDGRKYITKVRHPSVKTSADISQKVSKS